MKGAVLGDIFLLFPPFSSRIEFKGQRWKNETQRLTGRIQSVNVDAEIDGFAGTDPISDFLDNASCSNRVDLTCLDDLESAVAVVVVITEAGQGGANTRMNIGVVGQQAFSMRVEEIGAVVDGGLLAWGATEDLGPPSISLKRSMPP